MTTSANNPMAWADAGACRGQDQAIFFPGLMDTRPFPESVMADARAICGPCPVFADCHRHAVEHETEGIWAATDPHQRRRLRRAMGLSDVLKLGPRTKDEERTGATPPLSELDVNRSAAEVARAAGVSTRTVQRARAARRTA